MSAVRGRWAALLTDESEDVDQDDRIALASLAISLYAIGLIIVGGTGLLVVGAITGALWWTR